MAMRTRIKVCGISNAKSVKYVAQAGVDAIGFVFYPPSKRFVSLQQAVELRRLVPPMIALFGVFVNPSKEEVMQVIRAGVIDCLQFHGAEPESFCADFPLPYVKSVPMGSLGSKADEYMQPYEQSTSGFLLDSNRVDQAGGTGKTFDWQAHSFTRNKPIILSGGLHAQNVVDGIKLVQPYAVDVSSGVEDVAGCKDEKLIDTFITAVRSADNHS